MSNANVSHSSSVTQSITIEKNEENTKNTQPVPLVIVLKGKKKKAVKWDSEVIDNENLGKKSSKS